MIEILHLDLNVVEHCNFSCAACSHVSPLHKPWFMSLEEIEHDLTALKPILKVRNVNIVGGEPTLHKQLVDIIRLVKRIRIDEKTHVITNGSLLHKMSDEFWKELEFLKVSIYARMDKALLNLAMEKSKEYGFGIEATEFQRFYLQLFKSVPAPSEFVETVSSFRDCPWKTDCYTVHKGYFMLCPQSTFFPKTLMGLPQHTDGLALDGITEEALMAFMGRTEPLKSCSICTGSKAKSIPWKESNRQNWIQEATV